MRQRFHVFVSVAYIIIGVVVVLRSVAAQVLFAGILGLVFIALGAVRLRDYVTWRRKNVGS